MRGQWMLREMRLEAAEDAPARWQVEHVDGAYLQQAIILVHEPQKEIDIEHILDVGLAPAGEAREGQHPIPREQLGLEQRLGRMRVSVLQVHEHRKLARGAGGAARDTAGAGGGE